MLWSSREYVDDAVGSWRVFSLEVVRHSEHCVEKSRRTGGGLGGYATGMNRLKTATSVGRCEKRYMTSRDGPRFTHPFLSPPKLSVNYLPPTVTTSKFAFRQALYLYVSHLLLFLLHLLLLLPMHYSPLRSLTSNANPSPFPKVSDHLLPIYIPFTFESFPTSSLHF